ncbi:MAG: response regulator [Desulfobacteraceae bacterium]|nr:response regulator [Desulfobacteraceae bacterium]
MAKPRILIADDDDLVRDAVVRILEMFGYEVAAVDRGSKALEVLDDRFDLVLLDINMPGIDGFETMAAINERQLEIPVLFLTGAGSMEYAIRAINLGAYDFIAKPIEDLDLFEITIRRAVEKRMYVLRERAYKSNLEKEVLAKTRELAEKNALLEQYSEHLESSTVNTILTLQTALEEKDLYTAGHTGRVTEYAVMIGQALQLSPIDMEVLEQASQLHDIGKLVIDVTWLRKAGPLSPQEWEMVKKHPVIGENILKPLIFLEREGKIIRHHHERIDGKGYPDGLTGKDLDPLTKILTVADSYDAMTSMRSYRKNLCRAEAITELRRCAGTQFDPEVVETFISILEAFPANAGLDLQAARTAEKILAAGKNNLN